MASIKPYESKTGRLWRVQYRDPAGHDPRYEVRADRFAAQLLISPIDYALAEKAYGPHPSRLAAELGVTVHMINVWRDFHERKIPA